MVNVTLIHTVASLPQTFDALIAEKIGPEVEVSHMVDEMLLTATRRAGSVQEHTREHLETYGSFAEADGADVIVVTCSSVGPAVDQVAPRLGIPMLRVDAAMAEKAISLGRRIGVLATLHSTMAPTAELIERVAEEQGKEIELTTRLVERAFDAVTSGKVETHDRLVAEQLVSLMDDVDVVVLAQASMARVVATLPEDQRTVPVLSSPGLAVDRLAEVVSEIAAR